MFTYSTYWRRLILTFKDSLFEISLKTIKKLKTQAITLSVLVIIIFVLSLINYDYTLAVGMIFFLLYIISIVYLSIVFARNLDLFVDLCDDDNDDMYSSQAAIKTVTIDILARCTILVMITTITTLMQTVIVVIEAFVVSLDETITIILILSSSIDILINTVCLWLQFRFSNNIYSQLCYICDLQF